MLLVYWNALPFLAQILYCLTIDIEDLRFIERGLNDYHYFARQCDSG